MNNIIVYFVLGGIVSALMDYFAVFYQLESKLTNAERFVIIAIWPISVTMFIYYFIKENINKDGDA
tara:strand:- start:34 stop:231 length:198 start_codon:yes stop_codon:yes gene_type:complete